MSYNHSGCLAGGNGCKFSLCFIPWTSDERLNRYRLSPFTYLIEGLLGQALGRSPIVCSDIEYVTVDPPSGQTCGQFFEQYISGAGGYLRDPSASSGCQFCSFATTDEMLGVSFNISYDHRWRNVGIMFAYILFNVSHVLNIGLISAHKIFDSSLAFTSSHTCSASEDAVSSPPSKHAFHDHERCLAVFLPHGLSISH